jgi:Transposase
MVSRRSAQQLLATYRWRDADHPAARTNDWTVSRIDSGTAEIALLACSITIWSEEFLAYCSAGRRISNGHTEAVHPRSTKSSGSVLTGHGFRNFSNYRLRLPPQCGIIGQYRTPTSERGRLPRLAA